MKATSKKLAKLTGTGNTPLETMWRKHEQNHQMSAEDHLLGGPRVQLTLRQYARANGYDIKTGKRKHFKNYA